MNSRPTGPTPTSRSWYAICWNRRWRKPRPRPRWSKGMEGKMSPVDVLVLIVFVGICLACLLSVGDDEDA